MFRHMLRPFLPRIWTSPSPADYSIKEIDERVQVVLAEIEAEYDLSQFSLESFVEWVERKRSRPIEFVQLSFPSTVSGGWLKLPHEDWIFFEAETLPLYQMHIQLHELSHMLCEHQPIHLSKTADLETPSQIIDYLTAQFQDANQLDDANEPLRVHSHHTSPEEIEAECLSMLILERVSTRHFEKVLNQPVTFSKMAVDVYEAMGMA